MTLTDRPTAGRLAQVACLLEATAPKPGNVHRYCDFAGTGYLDFALSALAIGPALDRAATDGVGLAVLAAVRATRALVATNTNLGMVLLLAPLAAVPSDRGLRETIGAVLDATTVDDARCVYEAIRLAQPGGLGRVAEEDVAAEPSRPLRDVMALAADRDSVARQYATGFEDVFGLAAPALARALREGRPLETAVVASHLEVLAARPDTLILRKRGETLAADASRRAADVLAAGWPDRDEGRRLCDDLDSWLRADGHARNPGTTADLVTAGLFAALRDGTIQLPLTSDDWSVAGQSSRGGLTL
jgi:triphosphoribosyl-dephospho-CoA synthase